VHHERQHFELVIREAKENTCAHIVQTCLHSAVKGGEVIEVVALDRLRVHQFIGGFVVGLLEEDVGANVGCLQFLVILNRRSGNVDIDAADGAVVIFSCVDGVNGVHYIINRAIDRVLAHFQGQGACDPFFPAA
jgi:hypothetical protein